MTTYVIGDLQGCFDELQTLLTHIDYQADKDVLWFVGDIVNRGPKSLDSLRFVKTLQQQGKAAMVLGNHEFHLLATYAGLVKFASRSDTLAEILAAPDVDELMDWLRQQPLMVRHAAYPAVMVHAGIPPQWSINQAAGYAKEVETLLRAPNWQTFLVEHLFAGDTGQPTQWHDHLNGWDRVRYIVNAFARMRYCTAQGTLDYHLKGAPSAELNTKRNALNTLYEPWFVFDKRKNKDAEIFFGHWSTLGALDAYHVHATDTGCLWGGKLTAYAIEDAQRLSIDCPQRQKPKLKQAEKAAKESKHSK
jgi:bis(5'-nucleosyl)-tetraphosphatase (symmetrical)